MSTAPPADLPRLWRAALDRWSEAIDLALPRAIDDADGSIAYIDLWTRQTHVNFGRLAELGVSEHLPCVLAHEVGHHIRYPHTNGEARRMRRFHREVLCDLLVTAGDAGKPEKIAAGNFDWVLNVFFDLLINDELSDEYEDSFVAIFGALGKNRWSLSFAFYIVMFEELWNLAPGAMVPEDASARLSKLDPDHRARARAAGEFSRAHPENRPLQLSRFLVALRPYLVEDGKQGKGENDEGFERGGMGDGPIDGDDVTDLLRPRSDEEAARRWLREAIETGRVPTTPQEATGGNPLVRAKLKLQGLVPPDALALATYRREAERAALEVPASLEPGELVVPGPHEAWELGDDLEAIDWIGSVTRAGGMPIPSVNTVTRTRFADEPRVGDREMPWIELYIDSSGSMPDPKLDFSHQIEAGFILVRAATRAGGRVRVIQYSSQDQRVVMKEFTKSAEPAQRALLEYIGGGTDFPWDELASSVARFRRIARVRRIVISDSDFLYNATSPTPTVDVARVIGDAARAGGLTGLLAIGGGADHLIDMGMEVVSVAGWTGIANAARSLGEALFRKERPSAPGRQGAQRSRTR